jgi:hypothetical protein
MQFQPDEYMLLSRGGRVPRAIRADAARPSPPPTARSARRGGSTSRSRSRSGSGSGGVVWPVAGPARALALRVAGAIGGVPVRAVGRGRGRGTQTGSNYIDSEYLELEFAVGFEPDGAEPPR